MAVQGVAGVAVEEVLVVESESIAFVAQTEGSVPGKPAVGRPRI